MKYNTIAAISTPYGVGGIGIIRLSGENSFSIALRICKKTKLKHRFAHSCNFYDEASNKIDNGLIIYFASPNSYTGEDVIEIQSHGNYILLENILNLACLYGARISKPGEFTYRAFVNNKIDLVQAESINALIHAQTSSAAKSAQRSMSGHFSKIINKIINNLLNLRSLEYIFWFYLC